MIKNLRTNATLSQETSLQLFFFCAMSLTLPIQALYSMHVSFKVSLTDGRFTFDMVAGKHMGEVTANPLEKGMKLQLQAASDYNGVTLTVGVSQPEYCFNEQALQILCGEFIEKKSSDKLSLTPLRGLCQKNVYMLITEHQRR